jgi:hypothetical protein
LLEIKRQWRKWSFVSYFRCTKQQYQLFIFSFIFLQNCLILQNVFVQSCFSIFSRRKAKESVERSSPGNKWSNSLALKIFQKNIFFNFGTFFRLLFLSSYQINSNYYSLETRGNLMLSPGEENYFLFLLLVDFLSILLFLYLPTVFHSTYKSTVLWILSCFFSCQLFHKLLRSSTFNTSFLFLYLFNQLFNIIHYFLFQFFNV